MTTLIKKFFLATWMIAFAIVLSSCTKTSGIEFDIHEGNASETFLEFARQADMEIIFDPETVRDVKTHSVSGLMSPSKALKLMIEDTELSIHKDPLADAIAIRRKPIH